MLELLKKKVLEANLELPKHQIVKFTWGNASGIDREHGLVVIKPSGVPYDSLSIDDLVVVDLFGNRVEGSLNPSTDTATHLVLYRNFLNVGGIAHTHSPFGTSFAQAGIGIPALGTTHADYFYGEIPCTRPLSDEEIHGDYEVETGNVIAEIIGNRDPLLMPGVLVHQHAPFCWGRDPVEAVHHAVILEEVAKLALYTSQITSKINSMNSVLLDKHFFRKHGENAYYGQ